MIDLFKKIIHKNSFLKIFILLPILLLSTESFTTVNQANAGFEIQWDDDGYYKKLKWFQKNNQRRARNKIFFFLRPSDRKTGLLKINIKIPENFDSSLKTEKISLCQVKIGGFESRTECIKEIPADIELNQDKTSLDIYPFDPIPSDNQSYAVVFKIFNPKRTGLYQFHATGQASGKIPISNYLGSWTIVID